MSTISTTFHARRNSEHPQVSGQASDDEVDGKGAHLPLRQVRRFGDALVVSHCARPCLDRNRYFDVRSQISFNPALP